MALEFVCKSEGSCQFHSLPPCRAPASRSCRAGGERPSGGSGAAAEISGLDLESCSQRITWEKEVGRYKNKNTDYRLQIRLKCEVKRG